MGRDVIAELRGQDPARRARLDAVDPGALVALREGITMTERGTTETVGGATVRPARQGARRLGGRGALVGGLAVALAGGGVAFAATALWSDEEGAATTTMGIECREVLDVGYPGEGAVVARTLTGDPVADCQTFRSDAGLAPIADPVAFVLDGTLYVTPRDQVPATADLVEPDLQEAAALRELQASLADAVDGGGAQCLSADDAVPWVEGELARLGISGWSVQIVHGSDEEGTQPCSMIEIGGDGPRTVAVYPGMTPRVESWMPADLLDALRAIPEACLTVDEAAEAALGAEPHSPTTRVVDEAATCARVDVEGGGSTLVTVYGPTRVG